MLRIGLLDTTIQGTPGSMARYRDQLVGALRQYSADGATVTTALLGCDQCTLNRTPARLRMWRHHMHVWRSARNLDVSQFDVLHLLDGSFGYVAEAVRSNRVVVTVHDVIPRLQMSGFFPDAPRVGRAASWMIQRSLAAVKAARQVCSDSQSTSFDLQRFDCQPRAGLDIVPLAVDPQLFSQSIDNQPFCCDGHPDYVLHLGNNGFYKNRAGAIEILRRIDSRVDLNLVMAGPPANSAIKELVFKYQLEDRVRFVIDPTQERLGQLYRQASAFVFPSLYEGFGWPPLEAMSAGCPVVSSDAGSLPEVIGDAGVIARSQDYDAMARGCERLISDQAFRQQIIAKGHARVGMFSTKRLAETMIGVYASASQ